MQVLTGHLSCNSDGQQRGFSRVVRLLNVYSGNCTLGVEWQKLPLLIGALLNAHHARRS